MADRSCFAMFCGLGGATIMEDGKRLPIKAPLGNSGDLRAWSCLGPVGNMIVALLGAWLVFILFLLILVTAHELHDAGNRTPNRERTVRALEKRFNRCGVQFVQRKKFRNFFWHLSIISGFREEPSTHMKTPWYITCGIL
eukprot:1296905-Amorphochlora_amoeboformis.AAC.1